MVSFVSHLFLPASICIHVSDHLSDERPKKTQGFTEQRDSRDAAEREREPGASADEGSESLRGRVLTFDKRNKIIAKCKWTRCQLCSGAGHPHQDPTQMEPDIILFGAPPVLSSQ